MSLSKRVFLVAHSAVPIAQGATQGKNMQEEWRPVVGFEGFYEVSNLGSVKSVYWNPGRILKPSAAGGGYLFVYLSRGDFASQKYIHRIVGEAFVENIENKPEIDHIDGNKVNNRSGNLRWVTSKENKNNPLHRKRLSDTMKWRTGATHNGTRPIVCVETGRFYWGAIDAERAGGFNSRAICHVLKGRRKTSGGYHWRYASREETNIARQRLQGFHNPS